MSYAVSAVPNDYGKCADSDSPTMARRAGPAGGVPR